MKYFIMHENNEDGFTLIEILVVILIIGILAAIAVPVFLGQRKKANDSTLIADMKNISLMMHTEMNKNDFEETWKTAATFGNNASVISPTGPKWNPTIAEWKVDGKKLGISEGSYIRVMHYPTGSTTASWNKPHSPGDFCLFGANANGSHSPANINAPVDADLSKVLFYDVKLGGIISSVDLKAAYANNEDSSCYGMAKLL